MKNKFIIRLLLLAVFSIFLYSCMNEDLYSSSEKEKQEIQSKSLWKEDMVFITNVKEIFLKNGNLENFKNNHGGLPIWEYAMTFGNFDESYLMVPVFGEDKVTGVVTVKRIENMVYFKFSKDERAKSFFTHLISSENKKLTPVKEIAENAKIICTSRTYNLCFPNNDGTQDCYPQMVVKCISEDGFEDNDIGGDNSDNGLPYGGGGSGNTNPQQNQTPCAKTKAIVNKPQIKDSINSLKSFAQTSVRKERGFQELKNGTLVNGSVTGNLQVNFGIGPNSLGTMHVHPLKGIAMFSAGDIVTFLHLLRQQDGSTLGTAYAGMVSAGGTYFINFTGTASDIPPAMTEIQEKAYIAGLVTDYVDFTDLMLEEEGKNRNQQLSNQGLEKLFNYLINTMGLNGKITLIKEENGNTSTIEFNPDGTPKTPTPC